MLNKILVVELINYVNIILDEAFFVAKKKKKKFCVFFVANFFFKIVFLFNIYNFYFENLIYKWIKKFEDQQASGSIF